MNTPDPWIAAAVAFLCLPVAAPSTADQPTLPSPGIGVFFRADDVAALRAKIDQPPCREVYQRLRKQADEGLARWPDDKSQRRLAELAPQLPDLTMEFVPAEFSPPGGKEAGKTLEEHAVRGAPAAAFVFLMTGERKYADYAWDVFDLCRRVNRWGWFPWAGSHMPQIHFGIVSRNLVLVADCTWDALTPEQRRQARQAIAEKCVEPYFRIVLHTPGMALYHLRSRNQGNNALGAAVVGSLFVGDEVPENRGWFNSLLQTFHWTITHDIGWMGQGLESGIGGYWSVSMQNLYTAAAALANVRGIDLRGHPGFEQATWYPIAHEVTVPPVGMFANPIDPQQTASALGVIAGKPLELPGGAGRCGPWWYDYAARFPDTPAHHFVSKGMVATRGPVSPRPDGRDGRLGETPPREPESVLQYAESHQGALADVLAIAWWDDRLTAPAQPPTALALFTDRIASLRSGYGFGDTCLYFNGDLFLTARKEILAATSGMSWHFPWHQYAITETGVETEGEPFAPSMILTEAWHAEPVSFFRARAGHSNVAYYPQIGQGESYRHYERRERSVLYVRGGPGRHEYFVFLDDVRQPEPRWHAWTWHLWDSAEAPNNFGRFNVQGPDAIRAERPNADLWIGMLTPSQVTVEQHKIPSQPSVNYQMDHNARMLRAVAGSMQPTSAVPLTIPLSAWRDFGVPQDGAIFLDKPPTERPVTSAVVTGLSGGVRYRWSVRCKEEDYRVYEATAWAIDLELLDAEGHVLAKPQSPQGHPDPLRLGAPRSDAKTHDWTDTAQYFDAPPAAVACRATFRAVGGAHYFELGKLWLSPIELLPVGRPERRQAQFFLAVVMPLDKSAAPPTIVRHEVGGEVVHPDGTCDDITIAAGGQLGWTRRSADQVVSLADLAKRGSEGGTLRTNSEASAERLAAGLKPVLDQLRAQRDALTSQGRRNLARQAEVTASAERDERFAAARVIDNETAEYPADGHLDYTLGSVWSSGRFVGYGAGQESLLDNRDNWPLYVRPTYWLLPEETLGHVELELDPPAKVDLVRLLNTSNAGLNDFATHQFRVELYDAEHRLLASQDGAFGQVCDRPFRQAFVVPQWFSRYTPSFAGMLEPQWTVPFGDGWHDIRFAPPPTSVCFVRVVVTKYWGLGGGLNEVQVY